MNKNDFVKKTAEFIKFMNEDSNSEEAKRIRRDDYMRWVRGEPMTDEAKKQFVKDTVGTPDQWRKELGYVSQAKNIIKNETPHKKTEEKKVSIY